MQQHTKQNLLLKDIYESIKEFPDAAIENSFMGDHLVAIAADKIGLCTRVTSFKKETLTETFKPEGSLLETASLLVNQPNDVPDSIAYGFAAVNTLLPIPPNTINLKAQELILKYGRGRNAAVIGHFPFVEKMKSEFKNLWVLEMHPRPGDFPSDKASQILPEADVVAITATTLLNGTCAGILGMIQKKSFTIMLGPTTPFAYPLFDWGVNALGGCEINEPSSVIPGISKGLTYRQLKGITPLIWMP